MKRLSLAILPGLAIPDLQLAAIAGALLVKLSRVPALQFSGNSGAALRADSRGRLSPHFTGPHTLQVGKTNAPSTILKPPSPPAHATPPRPAAPQQFPAILPRTGEKRRSNGGRWCAISST